MTSGNRVVLFSGGELGQWALKEAQPGDYIIGVDRGALFLVVNGIAPDLVVGDFDSISPEELIRVRASCRNIVEYNCQKDYSDTELAFKLAIERKPREIILLGVLGSRFDHSFSNVQLLHKGLKEKVQCKIIDDHNEIKIINQSTTITTGEFSNISILPFSLEVTGVCLEGFEYPLQNRTLYAGESIGISNVLKEDRGTISLLTGELLVILSRD